MKTFTVPIFLGVRAETKAEAIEEALSFMEHALDVGNDEETFPYSYVGREDEVYAYLNDNHIDTALRNLVADLKET